MTQGNGQRGLTESTCTVHRHGNRLLPIRAQQLSEQRIKLSSPRDELEPRALKVIFSRIRENKEILGNLKIEGTTAR